ncbi:MAG: 60S ribosomal protein L12 [Paramarteilia canceri]
MPIVNGVNYVAIVTCKGFGGAPPSMASLSQQLAPLKIPPKKACDEISKKTQPFIKIRTVSHICIKNDGTFDIIPQVSTSMLIIKKIGSANKRVDAGAAAKGKKKKGAPAAKDEIKVFHHTGNLTMDDVIEIGRAKVAEGKIKELKQAVLSVVGTAGTMQVTIDCKSPKEVTTLLKDGYYAIPEQ